MISLVTVVLWGVLFYVLSLGYFTIGQLVASAIISNKHLFGAFYSPEIQPSENYRSVFASLWLFWLFVLLIELSISRLNGLKPLNPYTLSKRVLGL